MLVLHVCMSAGSSEMLVCISVFSNSSFDRQFSMVAREKNRKMLVFMEYVCMYVREGCTKKTEKADKCQFWPYIHNTS